MITANVIHRIFRIGVGESSGTAFTIEIDNREYLITAKHIAGDLRNKDHIQIFSNNSWVELAVNVVGHTPDISDISVLSANVQLAPPDLPMPATSKGVIYGQDVYFLGFPYGLLSKYIFGSDGYPLPFVKKAVVSLFDHDVFLLDGHNNPGFSGGPVIFANPYGTEYKVAAVISGYHSVRETIYEQEQQTDLTYPDNTGIIVSYSIDGALRLIENNPIGFKLGS